MRSANKRVLSAIVVALFALSILTSVVPVSAETKKIDVYEGQSIQAAIDLASPGDTIRVNAGTYFQSFTVNKQLVIESKGAILDLAGTSLQTAIFVVSSGVTISGFTIRNIPAQVHAGAIHFPVPSGSVVGGLVKDNVIDSGFYGIVLNGPSDIEIKNNRINAVNPIYIISSPNVVIKNNIVSAHELDSTWRGQGITLHPGSSGLVKGNEIDSVADGIRLSNPSNLEIKNNIVHSSINAFIVYSGSDMTVKNNVFYASQNGVTLSNPTNIIVKGNTIFSESVAISSYGLSSNLAIANNILYAGGNGISSYGPSSNLAIANNILYAGGNGISLNNVGMTNPVITKNVVYCDNYGISLSSISEATVKYNKVHINQPASGQYPTGILISGGTSNQVAMNIVTGDFITGIFLAGSNLNTIDKNVITGVYRYDPNYEDAGIRLWDANDNTGTKNLITGVRLPIEDQGVGNIFTP
jgi:parallel beta-helix repeat protein